MTSQTLHHVVTSNNNNNNNKPPAWSKAQLDAPQPLYLWPHPTTSFPTHPTFFYHHPPQQQIYLIFYQPQVSTDSSSMTAFQPYQPKSLPRSFKLTEMSYNSQTSLTKSRAITKQKAQKQAWKPALPLPQTATTTTTGKGSQAAEVKVSAAASAANQFLKTS